MSGSNLVITTRDPGAEVVVTDSRFRKVGYGAGRLELDVGPGIYQVLARTGTAEVSRVAIVPPGESTRVDFDRLAFSSGVPLEDTATSHEYHMSAAAEHSKNVHRHRGEGASIFVFARDLHSGVQSNAGLGIRVLASDSVVVTDLAFEGARDERPDAWAACNTSVTPGTYELIVECSAGTVSQSLVAAQGWQLQVFLLRRLEGGVPTIDPSQTAIFYTRLGTTFSPTDEDARRTETARLGLVNRRRVIRGDLGELLRHKFENPMLGLFGGHLLLLEEERDEELLGTVLRNLRTLLGTHPDVEAIAVAAGLPMAADSFASPPMLRQSWRAMVNASISRPSIVPRHSWASRIATGVLADSLWLHWMLADASDEDKGALRDLSARMRTQAEERELSSDILFSSREEAFAIESEEAAIRGQLVRSSGLPWGAIADLLNE